MRERTDPTKLAMLRQFPGLGSASDHQLAQVASAVDVLDVPAGRRILTQGRMGRSVCLIVSGHARIERDGREVATVAAGAVVGEVGALHRQVSNATVEAITPMRLLLAGPAAIGDLLDLIGMRAAQPTAVPRIPLLAPARAVRGRGAMAVWPSATG